MDVVIPLEEVMDIKELSSRIEDQEKRIVLNDARLVQLEEQFKEQISRVSSDLKELSKNVAEKVSISQPEGEPSSGKNNFQKSYFEEMMASVSLPGTKFMGEKNNHWIHIYVWVFIHVVALLISYVLIKDEYGKWKNSPIVNTISNKLAYVNDIPLPAVTMCYPVKYLNPGFDVEGIAKKCISCEIYNPSLNCALTQNCTYEEKVSLAIASGACPVLENPTVFLQGQLLSSLTERKYSLSGAEFIEYSKNVFPSCNDFISRKVSCSECFGPEEDPEYWLSRCESKKFFKFMSRFDLCLTMGGFGERLLLKKNTVVFSGRRSYYEHLKNDDLKEVKEENRIIANETDIHFNEDKNQSMPLYIPQDVTILYMYAVNSYVSINKTAALCQPFGNTKGIKLIIHNTHEIPFIPEFYDTVEEKNLYLIEIIPEMITTEKGLESYKPTERGCFYSHERELAMFKNYTEQNCKTECKANCSLQICGCVPYNLPRHNSSVDVCLSRCPGSTKCYIRGCNCLPDCYRISYGWQIKKGFHPDQKLNEYTIILKFKEGSFYPTVRVSLTNLGQFLAYSLGIVGVFNGFSVMVICEVLYFFACRLWNHMKSCTLNKIS